MRIGPRYRGRSGYVSVPRADCQDCSGFPLRVSTASRHAATDRDADVVRTEAPAGRLEFRAFTRGCVTSAFLSPTRATVRAPTCTS
jgi:hypothetical protein